MNLSEYLSSVAELPEFCSFEEPLTVHSISGFGNTPVNVAAIQGDIEALELLLSAGANINHRGEHGSTPLHDAVIQGNRSMAKALLDKGAATDIANDDGLTALDWANLFHFTLE